MELTSKDGKYFLSKSTQKTKIIDSVLIMQINHMLLDIIGFQSTFWTLWTQESRDYEDVIDIDILKAPICDISSFKQAMQFQKDIIECIKSRKQRANLNSNSGGIHLFLYQKGFNR